MLANVFVRMVWLIYSVLNKVTNGRFASFTEFKMNCAVTALERGIRNAEMLFITDDHLKDGKTKLPYPKGSKLYLEVIAEHGEHIKNMEQFFINLLQDDVLVHVGPTRCDNLRMRLELLKLQQLLTEAECGSSS